MRKSSRGVNPFYYKAIKIPEKYFCDRKTETEKIIGLIESGNNVVLKAPRRLGKSSLLQHIFNQKPFKSYYNTIYVDIYPTKSSDAFVLYLYKAIKDCRTISDKSGLKEMERRLKEISFDAEFSIPNILKVSKSSKYEMLKLEESLDILFDFLSKTKRPNLVVIDEFQQIRNYKDNNIEASLRTFIQKTPNTSFIFSGSSKHMLTQIFESPTQPFYKSSRSMALDIIPEDKYIEFCTEQFASYGKQLNKEAGSLVYNVCCGNTFLMQQTMNCLFESTLKGDIAETQDAKAAIESLLEEKTDDYREFLHRLKPNYELVLLSIAKEGIASNFLSEAQRRKYNLPATTTISNILEYFLDDRNRIIEEIAPNTYRLEDKFLELWIAKYIFGGLDSKYEYASEILEKETELRKQIVIKTQNT